MWHTYPAKCPAGCNSDGGNNFSYFMRCVQKMSLRPAKSKENIEPPVQEKLGFSYNLQAYRLILICICSNFYFQLQKNITLECCLSHFQQIQNFQHFVLPVSAQILIIFEGFNFISLENKIKYRCSTNELMDLLTA